MFCFNEFAFTVQVKHKISSIQILGFILICLHFTTGHFHSTHVYSAKNVAYVLFNSWLGFQRLCHLLWGIHLSQRMLSCYIPARWRSFCNPRFCDVISPMKVSKYQVYSSSQGCSTATGTHMPHGRSHSVTCHPAEVAFRPLTQPKLVHD